MSVDVSDFVEFGAAAHAAAARIEQDVDRRLERLATESSRDVIADGSDGMPSSGGLRSELMAGGSVQVSRTSEGVEIAIGHPSIDLAYIDAGTLSHPVFRRAPWVTQSAPAGTFSRALEDVQAAVDEEVGDVLDEIGRHL